MATAQQTLNSPGKLTSTPAPTVTQLIPQSGTSLGGTQVIIVGSNFTGATAVNFGQAAATITSVTDSSITVTTPPGSRGPVDVTVTTTLDGISATSNASQFQFGFCLINITIDANNNVSINPKNIQIAIEDQIQWAATLNGLGDPFPFAVCFGNPLFPTPLMFIGVSREDGNGNVTGSQTTIYTVPPPLIPGAQSNYSYKVVCMSNPQNVGGVYTFPSTDPVVIVSPS
jgi:hypothetical protein